MPSLKNDLINLRRDTNALAKMLESHGVFNKQQTTLIKKLLNQIITVMNAFDDSKLDKA